MLALLSLYILLDLLTHREGAITKYDVPWEIVGRYYLAFAPKMIYMVSPLAVLVSALLVLGETAQHNEVTAALAGGISLRRFSRTPVLIAVCFALALFAMEQLVGAKATREALRIEEQYFSRSHQVSREGISWANLEGGWTCHIWKFNRIALTGEDVLIHSIRDDDVEQIEADRIFWDEASGRWLLEDGRWWIFEPFDSETSGSAMWTRITQRPAPFKETPDQLFALERPPETMTVGALEKAIHYAASHAIPVQRLWVDYHAKFSWPAISFVMIGLAVPFALRLRRGGIAISFGASIAIALTFLVIHYSAMSLGHAGHLHPVVAAWIANAVFFLAGLVMFFRTPT